MGRDGLLVEGRLHAWLTRAAAQEQFESSTTIRLEAVRLIVAEEQGRAWDAWLFLGGPGRSQTADGNPVELATRRLAGAVRLFQDTQDRRRSPVVVGHERAALVLAQEIVDRLAELDLPSREQGQASNEPEGGTARGRLLRDMLAYHPDLFEPIVKFAADLEEARRVFDPDEYLSRRPRHRPKGNPFANLCLNVARALIESKLVQGPADGPRSIDTVCLFLCAMDLVPPARGSHQGQRFHFPRLYRRVEQALYRSS